MEFEFLLVPEFRNIRIVVARSLYLPVQSGILIVSLNGRDYELIEFIRFPMCARR